MGKKPKKTFKDRGANFIEFIKSHKIQTVLILLAIIFFSNFTLVTVQRATAPAPETISYKQFEQAINDETINDVCYNTVDQEINGSWDPDGDGIYSNFQTTCSTAGYDKLKEELGEHPSIKFKTDAVSKDGLNVYQSSSLVLSAIALIAFLITCKIRKDSEDEEEQITFGNHGKDPSKPKKYKKPPVEQVECPDVHFSDVAGCEEALEEVAEIKEFLVNSEKFTRLGAKIPCGVLMAGPPGCGKTLMAKAIAGESGAAFFSMSGSDFVEMYVGVGAKRVRELFESARMSAPAIVFIDEIDAVGKKRAAGGSTGGDTETDRTLNQLLVEMDGFSETDNIIVIAATNRIDTLDPALLRPGRFDRHVTVDLPDKGGRQEILKVHSKNKPLAEDVDLEHYATITAGMSGAQLENLMNEAAIFAARENANEISNVHMNAAFERIVAGAEKKGRVLSEDEKRTTAYHEAGHAIVGHMLEGAEKVTKISIISRGQALGYTLTLPENDTFLHKRQHLKNKLAMFLGGLVAEEMINDYDISTGPSNDLERATKMATAMATKFGMCDELGRRAFVNDDRSLHKSYSESKGREIDDAVDELMTEAHDTAFSILTKHRDRLDKISEVLVVQEVIEGEEMLDLLNGCWKGFGAYEPENDEQKKEDNVSSDDNDLDDDSTPPPQKKKPERETTISNVIDNARSLKDKLARKKKSKTAS